jgi:ferritin
MALSEKMEKALNDQINAELFSSYLYQAMAADFQAKNWKGFAAWLRAQAGEEQGHAMKFAKYVEDRLGRVTLKAIAEPPAEWASPLAAFEAVAEHEAKVTGLINKLVALAAAEKDNATSILLQWFVTEQVEEEAHADDIVQKLRRIKDSVHGLFMLDSILGQRK